MEIVMGNVIFDDNNIQNNKEVPYDEPITISCYDQNDNPIPGASIILFKYEYDFIMKKLHEKGQDPDRYFRSLIMKDIQKTINKYDNNIDAFYDDLSQEYPNVHDDYTIEDFNRYIEYLKALIIELQKI